MVLEVSRTAVCLAAESRSAKANGYAMRWFGWRRESNNTKRDSGQWLNGQGESDLEKVSEEGRVEVHTAGV